MLGSSYQSVSQPTSKLASLSISESAIQLLAYASFFENYFNALVCIIVL